MAKRLLLEQFDSNSDEAVVIDMLVEDMSQVKQGQTVCSVETTKTLYEVIAPSNGLISWKVKRGQKLPFGGTLAVIGESETDLKTIDLKLQDGEEDTTIKATKRARRLAAKHQVDLRKLDQGAIITEEDVQKFLGQSATPSTSSKPAVRAEGGVYAIPKGVKRIAVFGGGVGSMQVLDLLFQDTRAFVESIFDDDATLHGRQIDRIAIRGSVEEGLSRWEKGEFDEGVIVMNPTDARKKIFELGKKFGGTFRNAIDPTARISHAVSLGEGNNIFAFVHIGAHSTIGNGNSISAKCGLSHHNTVGDFNNFGPSVVTSGEVAIGSSCIFGTGIFIQPMILIGDRCRIASGAVIINSIDADSAVQVQPNYRVKSLRE